MGQDARLDLSSITFSQRGPIVETDQDAHVPWHATHSITEPKSVITRESHPKLVSHPLSHPLSFSLASSLHNGTEGAAAVSTAFSRTLSPDCPPIVPRLELARGDLLPGSDWFSPRRGEKSGHWRGWMWKVKKKEKKEREPALLNVLRAIDLFLETFKF